MKTFSYKKLFINNDSLKIINNYRNKNISPYENSNYIRSENQSDIKMKILKNKNKELSHINTDRSANLKHNQIKLYKNKNKRISDNKLIKDFIPFNERGLQNNKRRMFSASDYNKFNNIKLDQTNVNKKNKIIYQNPKKVVIDMKNISQINNGTSNINIKQNFIFPIKNYLNNCIKYKKIGHSTDNFFRNNSNNY